MGRFPCGSDPRLAEAVAVALLVLEVDSNVWESESPEGPLMEDSPGGRRDLLYRDPGTPGRVGSSRVPCFFDSITTTRRMLGRSCGSPCVHSSPI
jgi:hypothetical protein